MTKKILIIITLLFVSSNLFAQNRKITVNVLAGVDSIQIGGRYFNITSFNDSTEARRNIFTDLNTFRDTIRFTALGQDNDSVYTMFSDTMQYYTNGLKIIKKRGHMQLQLRNEDPGTGFTTALTFQNTETGRVDGFNNSFVAQVGADFFVGNMAPGLMVFRSNGHDNDKLGIDTSGIFYFGIKNKGNVANNSTKYRSPISGNSAFRFGDFYYDSTGSYPAFNIGNRFSDFMGLNIYTKNGLITGKWINASDSSLNFTGANIIRTNFASSLGTVTFASPLVAFNGMITVDAIGLVDSIQLSGQWLQTNDIALLNTENSFTADQTFTNGLELDNSDITLDDGDVRFANTGGDVVFTSTGYVYFGNEGMDGTWRMGRSGNDLIIQRRESGSYVTKQTFTP